MHKNTELIFAVVILMGMAAGCQARPPAQKLKDKVEDATHEAGQAIERAGDKIKDAAN